MRIVVAPDSFKGTATATDAAAAIAAGWRSVRPGHDVVERPMADGGEGTLAAIEAATPGSRRVPVALPPPVGDPRDGAIEAAWLLLPPEPGRPGGTGVVELASTSGIELLGDRPAPWQASTDGFGTAIAAALDAGVSRLVLAVGSSASTDGGAGLLSALGARFAGPHPSPPHRLGAGDLAAITSVDLGGLRALPPGGVVVLTDVTSPLTGEAGAAARFGPQKGFRADELGRADALLRDYAVLFDVDPATPGAGAAGGAGFGLLVWGAALVPGAAEIARLLGLAETIDGAGLVITGEGSLDRTTADGKAPSVVAALARSGGVPIAAVAGRIAPDADISAFTRTVSLTDVAGDGSSARVHVGRWLRDAGAALAAETPDR